MMTLLSMNNVRITVGRINTCWWTLKGQQPITSKMARPSLIGSYDIFSSRL